MRQDKVTIGNVSGSHMEPHLHPRTAEKLKSNKQQSASPQSIFLKAQMGAFRV